MKTNGNNFLFSNIKVGTYLYTAKLTSEFYSDIVYKKIALNK